MKKKLLIVSIILVFSIVIIGLILNTNNFLDSYNPNVLESDLSTKIIVDASISQYGVLSYQENNILNLTDLDSGKTLPICSKLNCNHLNENCNAFYSSRPFVCIYGNTLYTIENQALGECVISKSNVNGLNRRDLIRLEGNISNFYDFDYTLENEKLYFILDTRKYNEEDYLDLDLDVAYTKDEYTIMCFDLKTEEVSVLLEVEPKYGIHFSLFKQVDNFLYIEQQSTDVSSRDIFDEETGEYDPDFLDEVSNRGVYRLNLETKESEIISENSHNNSYYNNNIKITENSLYFLKCTREGEEIFLDDNLYRIDLETGIEEIILSNSLIKDHGVKVFVIPLENEIIINDFINKKIFIYDLSGELKHTINDSEWNIINEYENFYLLNQSETRLTWTNAFIDKENFILGEKEPYLFR